MKNLHPGARWQYRLRAYWPLLLLGIFVTSWTLQILKFIAGWSFEAVLVLAVIFYILFVTIIAEIYARMSYNRFLYEVTDEGIKIEQGVISKKYTSIPYERVQNVDIHRGIIARIFGFSTLQIETAGQSGIRFGRRGNRQYKSEGYIPAVGIDEAEPIRTFVMKKIKQTNRELSGI